MRELARKVLPPPLYSGLWRMKNAIATPARLQKYLGMAGYAVAERSDYYSPLVARDDLRATAARWNRPSALTGIKYDLDAMRCHLDGLLRKYLREFLEYPPYEELRKLGFGPGYTAVDALTLYAQLRHLKPRRYLEVGSGLSTYYSSLAAARNAREGQPMEITCIEPYPYEGLYQIPGIQVIVKPVQDVDLSLFGGLDRGDVLFIDSSHVLRIDGDVPYVYLEVMPALAAGVVIHIHDIPFPYNVPYPASLWVFGKPWPMLWNEAMVVQAFLCMNDSFRIVMSTPLIRHFDEGFLQARIPFYETVDQNPNTFSSLWLERVA